MSVKVCLWYKDQDNPWDGPTLPQRTVLLSVCDCLCDSLGSGTTVLLTGKM